jgi:very-short-patch-repair endonuclease
MTKIFNVSEHKARRRALRNEMTEAESKLWSRIRGRQVLGYKFRRQYGIGSYIVDFFCTELKLALEVDGDSHFYPAAQDHDARRAAFIESLGIRILRFTNEYVTIQSLQVKITLQSTDSQR